MDRPHATNTDSHTTAHSTTKTNTDSHTTAHSTTKTNTDTTKQSRTDKLRSMTDGALETLGTQLKSGYSDGFADFLRAMGRFHTYSFNNVLLIISQRPDASRVAGFHAWKRLGRSVKKGERGIAIFAPMRVRSKETKPDGDEDAGTRIVFRVAHVFDVSQTEGRDLPEPPSVQGNPGEKLDRIKAAIRASGITLEFRESLGGAEGVSRGGTILIREGLPPAAELSVLAHEWAHELLHRDPGVDRPSKTVRETEAEAVAFVVSQAIGLETGRVSADYIRLYRGTPETLAESCGRIQTASGVILDALVDHSGSVNGDLGATTFAANRVRSRS